MLKQIVIKDKIFDKSGSVAEAQEWQAEDENLKYSKYVTSKSDTIISYDLIE